MLSKIKRNILTIKELADIEGMSSFFKKSGTIALSKVELDIAKLIKEKHNEYIQTISSAEMAISLELSLLLYQMAITFKPKIVLDFGAGFSSFILRMASKNSTNFVVYSVDDDKNWLQKTISFLCNNKLSIEHIYSLEEFNSLKDIVFDIVLLDLNFVEIRKNYIHQISEFCAKGGFIIFDDTHKIEYLRIVKEQARKENISLFNFKKCTLDSFNRFALIGIK